MTRYKSIVNPIWETSSKPQFELRAIKYGEPGYFKPLSELIDDLGNADSGPGYGNVIITVEDLEDTLYYLKELQSKTNIQ